MEPTKPLSHYISSALIKEYLNMEDFENIQINENVKVIKMNKKQMGRHKKKDWLFILNNVFTNMPLLNIEMMYLNHS